MFDGFHSGWRLLLTVSVMALVLGLRHEGIRRVRERSGILDAAQRRYISGLHYSALLVILVFMLLVWLPQLQRFVLSITAIAVALVVATKELLLCLSGALLSRTSRSFVIGDWIAVQDRFGEVIERNLLSTTVQEVEPRGFTYTGRTITLPNSVFLGASIANQNFLRRFQFHRFQLVIEPDAFPFDAEARLEARVRAVCEPFAETAKRYNAMLEMRTGIDIPDSDPSIEFSTSDIAKLVTTITVFCPTTSIVEVEKAVTREFFEWYRNNRRNGTQSGQTD